jgi:hypothetical protein
MWTQWTSGLDDNAKQDFEQMAKASSPVLQRAIEIIEAREQELDQEEYNTEGFGSPSWPYLQAALVGRRAELRSLKQLLSLRPEGLK